MKVIRLFGMGLLLVCLFMAKEAGTEELTLRDAPSKVCFTPGGDCAKTIIGEIDGAKREVLMQAYSFTSAPIRKALAVARRRGVLVEVILDKATQQDQNYRTADLLKRDDVAVFIDDGHIHAHNKVIIIDKEITVTGSFNFTYAADEDNAENILVIRSPALAAIYGSNWTLHKQHSKSY